MSIKGVSSRPIEPNNGNRPIAKNKQSTDRFNNKMKNKITNMFQDSHRRNAKVDHLKFTAQGAIAEVSPEVKAIQENLSKNFGK